MRQGLYLLLTIVSLLALRTVEAQQFQYDDAGRLVAAVYSNGGIIRYEYDANGNIAGTEFQSNTPAPVPPNGVIDAPAANVAIDAGQAVTFTGTGSDADNAVPLTYLWNFGGGATNSTAEDPGATTFATAGTFTVTFTVTDADGLVDPTPDTVVVTVNSATGGGGNGGKSGGGATFLLPLICLLAAAIRNRRSLALGVLFLAGAANAQVTWTEMTSGTTQNLNDVWMESANLAYAVGENGTVLRFDGADWTTLDVGTTVHLSAVWGTGPNDVWVVGRSGTVLNFDGSAWSTVDIGAGTLPLNDVWVTGQTVYVVGGRGVWRGENGVWTRMSVKVSNFSSTLDPNHNMTAIRGSQNYRVMTASGGGGLDEGLFVSDGAFSNFDWVGLSTFDLNAIWVYDDTFMLAVGNATKRLNGTDPTSRSSSWQNYGVGVEGTAVWGTSPQSIWVAGNIGTSGRIVFGDGTKDDPWTPQLTVSFRQFRGLHGVDDQTLMAVGSLGIIYAAFAEAPEPPPPTSSNFFYTHRNDDGVNTATGELIHWELDFALPGDVPVIFGHYFSGFLGRNTDLPQPFGPGWSHPYNWVLVDNVGPNQVKVVDYRGTEYLFENNGAGYNLVSPGWANVGLVANGNELIFYDRESSQRAIFDSTTGRLTEIKDRSGNSLLMDYNNGRLTSLSDTSGSLMDFSYGANGQVERLDVATLSRTFAYDTNGNLESTTSPQGDVTRYSYDANGNFLSATYGAGTTAQTNRFSYEYQDDRVVRTHRNGGDSIDYAYDTANNRTTVTEADGSQRTYVYDGAGRLTTEISATGNEQVYGYDALGRRVSTTDGEGRQTRTTYDPDSNRIGSMTDPDGLQVSYVYTRRNSADGTTSWNVEEIRHPDGGITRYRYDASGNLIQIEDPEGIFTDFTYDAKGDILTRKVGAAGTETYTYDSRRQLAGFTDVNGNTTTYGYDSLGRVVEEINALGTRTYTYSNRAAPDQVETRSGAIINYTYDALGRRVHTQGSNGVYLQTSYDAAGNLVRQDLSGQLTADVTYDGRLRRASVARNGSVVFNYGYDADDRLVRFEDAAGDATQLGYDRSNRVTAIVPPNNETVTLGRTGNLRGLVDMISRGMESFSLELDAMGRIASVADATGRQLSLVRDLRGLPVQANFAPLNLSWLFGHDDIGNIESITDPAGDVYTRKYGGDRWVDEETDAIGQVTRYARNAANQLMQVSYADGLVVDIFYGGNGFPSRVTGSDGTDYAVVIGNDGRVQSGTNHSRTTTASGVVTESNGVTASTDAQDRAKRITVSPALWYEYTYNADGEVIRIDDSLGGVTTIEWTELGQIARLTYPGGATTTFTWDPAGRKTSASFSGQGSITATRDPLSGRIEEIISTVTLAPSIPDLSLDASYGPGSRLADATYDARNNVTGFGSKSFEWDAFNRLVGFDNGAETKRIEYDVFGQRVKLDDDGNVTTFVPIYSLDKPVIAAELDSAGNVSSVNVQLPDGQMLFRIDASSDSYQIFNFDLKGNTSTITDETGTVLASYSYSPTDEILASFGTIGNDCTVGCQLGYWSLGDGVVGAGDRWIDTEAGYYLDDNPWEVRASLRWSYTGAPIRSGRSIEPSASRQIEPISLRDAIAEFASLKKSDAGRSSGAATRSDDSPDKSPFSAAGRSFSFGPAYAKPVAELAGETAFAGLQPISGSSARYCSGVRYDRFIADQLDARACAPSSWPGEIGNGLEPGSETCSATNRLPAFILPALYLAACQRHSSLFNPATILLFLSTPPPPQGSESAVDSVLKEVGKGLVLL